MNKYQESFQRWKNLNFNPEPLPDDREEAGRILDENEKDYALVQVALKKAEKWDKLQSDSPVEIGVFDVTEELNNQQKKLEAIKSPALTIKTRLHSIVNYPAYENAERVEPKKEYVAEMLETAKEILKILGDQTSTETPT